MNNVFIEEIDHSIRHRLRNYWATNPQADLIDIALQAESLLAIQRGSGQQSTVSEPLNTTGKPSYSKTWNKRCTTNNVNTDTKRSPTRSFRRRSKPSPVMPIQHSAQPSSNSSAAPSFSLLTLSVRPSFCNKCYDPSHFASRFPPVANQNFAHFATICSGNMQKPAANYRR